MEHPHQITAAIAEHGSAKRPTVLSKAW